MFCHLIHYCFHSVFHTEHHSHIPLSGPVIPGLHMGRPPMVEKAVQTLNLEAFRQGRSLNVFQEDQQQQQQQQWPRRNLPRSRAEVSNPRRIAESVGNDVFTEVVKSVGRKHWFGVLPLLLCLCLCPSVKLRPVAPVELQETRRQYNENRPPPRRRQGAGTERGPGAKFSISINFIYFNFRS